MDSCKDCKNKIDPLEIYTDWFYCKFCRRERTYHRERLNPEDHFANVNEMVSESPNSENKESR